MDRARLIRLLPAVAAVAGAGALAFVVVSGPRKPLAERVPSPDETRAGSGSGPVEFATAGRLVPGEGAPSDLPGSWPWFRGPDGDGVSRDPAPLSVAWNGTGPREIWRIEVGEGYAGAAVRDGRVYVLDYDQRAQSDALRCLSLADGREIWRFAYPVRVKRNHGMSRTVPAVNGRVAVSLGPKCHVVCVDASSGAFRWGLDLVHEFGTTVPPWYAGQCPLLDGDRLVLAPAGRVLLTAVNAETGETVWETPNPRGWHMTHSSVVPFTADGRKMYVYCASGGIAGVDAEDGTLLWETDAWRISIATIPSPLPVGDGRLFLSGGYNAGSLMLRVAAGEDGAFRTEELFRLPAGTFGATQHTPVLYDGFVYGVRANGELVCLDLDGRVQWASGGAHRFGLGPFMVADGKILVMDDSGTLTAAAVSPAAFRPLGRARVLEGAESWAPMALASGRLILRDLERMICLDLNRNPRRT